MEEIILRAEDLCVGYGKRTLIRDVDIAVRPGEILTLIGPNGVGKSTILKTITRQLSAMEGVIYIGKERLEQLPERRLAQTMSILMTQRVEPELMTCEDVVSAGRYPYTGRFGILSEEDKKQVAAAMELVSVTELKDTDFNRISDGQRQRVMLARAICQEPSILILDEPTSFLDIRYKLELLEILRTLTRENKTAVIMSLHELELARSISDQILCIRDGVVDRCGPPREIFSGGYIQELYQVGSGFRDIYGVLEFAPKEKDDGL